MRSSFFDILGRWARFTRGMATSFSSVLVFIAALTLAMMTIFFGVAVVMRYVFNAPLVGDVEIVSFMLAIMFPLTMGYCAVKKGHVRVEVLVSRLTAPVQAILKCMTNGFLLVFLIMLIYAVIAQSFSLWRDGIASIIFKISMFPFALVAVLGFIGFALITVADFLDSVLEVARNESR